MSAVFALMNKERGGIDLKAQVLLYPVANADFDTPSYFQFAEGYYLTRDGMKGFWDAYTTDPTQRTEVYASPLQASLEQLRGLPTTLVITVPTVVRIAAAARQARRRRLSTTASPTRATAPSRQRSRNAGRGRLVFFLAGRVSWEARSIIRRRILVVRGWRVRFRY